MLYPSTKLLIFDSLSLSAENIDFFIVKKKKKKKKKSWFYKENNRT